MQKTPVSAVIITYNEEALIANTLSALGWCDEILVVDSGSTDRTADICKSFGCRVLTRTFDGYGPQKRFAVAQARHDWILALDADEVLGPELQQEIKALFNSGGPACQGYYLPRTLVFLGRQIRSEYKKPFLRLFDRQCGNFNNLQVHEKVEMGSGSTGRLKHHFLHYSYRSPDDYFRKFNQYTSTAARELAERGKYKPPAYIALRLPLDFIKIYCLQGCFRSGFPGFVWALFSAFYPVVKYTKLWVLQKKR